MKHKSDRISDDSQFAIIAEAQLARRTEGTHLRIHFIFHHIYYCAYHYCDSGPDPTRLAIRNIRIISHY